LIVTSYIVTIFESLFLIRVHFYYYNHRVKNNVYYYYYEVTLVVVPADKASNNIVFVCKTYYIDCLVKQLGINNNRGNPTYTPTSLSKEEILSNHKSFISSFGLSIKDDYVELRSFALDT